MFGGHVWGKCPDISSFICRGTAQTEPSEEEIHTGHEEIKQQLSSW